METGKEPTNEEIARLIEKNRPKETTTTAETATTQESSKSKGTKVTRPKAPPRTKLAAIREHEEELAEWASGHPELADRGAQNFYTKDKKDLLDAKGAEIGCSGEYTFLSI